jgi:hypothetical protein
MYDLTYDRSRVKGFRQLLLFIVVRYLGTRIPFLICPEVEAWMGWVAAWQVRDLGNRDAAPADLPPGILKLANVRKYF